MWEYNHNPELYHFGIKGMKWGVRRYQNYDGSYTQRGLARYRKAQEDYDSAKERASQAKRNYKSGSGTRQQYKDAKREVTSKKEKLKGAYSKLKTDKLADQGKELYRKGKTITGNQKVSAIAQVGVIAGSRITQRLIASRTGNTSLANIAASTIGVGGTVVNAIIAGKNYRQNKRLRAYYGH